jgi:hypothetical protein
VFSILYVSSGWLVQRWVSRRYQRAVFSDDNLSIQTLPHRVALSADGVTFSCDAGIWVYRWPFIRQVVRGSRYVCFVLTPLDRMHIPLRAFQDDKHVQQFISTAEAYVHGQTAQLDAPPNGGPTKPSGDSGASGGPPSVS